MNDWKTVIDTINTCRIKNNITQVQIQKTTGIKQANISKFFKGSVCPTIETIYKIAKACKVAKLEIVF